MDNIGMKDNGPTRDDVIENLRACLISAKGGVPTNSLNSDYQRLIGHSIPYQKLGFSSLYEFLKGVPSIILSRRGGLDVVEARPTEQSAHISRLIARQKSAPKKPVKRNMLHQRPMPSTWNSAPLSDLYRFNPRMNKENHYHRIDRNKHVSPPKLMSVQPSQFAYVTNERPRFMVNPRTPLSSPSKQYYDKKANSTVPIQSQSKRLEPQTLATPIVSPVQLASVPKPTQAPPPPKSVHIPSALQSIQVPSYLSSIDNAPKTRVNLSERLVVKPSNELLSPLSPAQLLLAGSERAQSFNSSSAAPTNERLLSENAEPDSCEELKKLTRALHLPEPVYTIPLTKKKEEVYARVVVGSLTFSSYPDERRTDKEAKVLAAKVAIKSLNEKFGSFSGLVETTDKQLIGKRVSDIVSTHPYGVFMEQLPVYYEQEYKETLPENWLKIIEENSEIVLNEGVNNSTILCPPCSCAKQTEEPTSPRMEEAVSVYPKADKIQLNPIGPAVPGQLQLPQDDYWVTYVTLVISTVEVWVRFVGEDYSELFDIMAIEMEQHYKGVGHSLPSPVIAAGNFYAVYDDNFWHRVQCLEYNSTTGVAVVLFIDHGDEDSYQQNQLYTLDKKFCKLPAQAIRVCLAGLEEFTDYDEGFAYLEEFLLGHTLYAQLVNHDATEHATVVFYDAQEPEDVNVNELLIKKMMHHILIEPELHKEGLVTEVFISHVEENGDVFVQIKSENMKLLFNLLNKLMHTGLSQEHLRTTSIDTTKIYFALCHEDGKWYRAKVVAIANDNLLKMFLIDLGRTILVSRKDLITLDKLSDVLPKFPPQALKVRLHNIPSSMFSDRMVARLMELAPHREPLLVKVITPASNGALPEVELFKRIQPENVLVSINHTLALEPELTKSGDGNNNTRSRKRVDRMISRHNLNGETYIFSKSLKPPRISDIDHFFDVHVTMAANPGNFTVQPFDDNLALQAMMVELQETCLKNTDPHPNPDSVVEGALYAAKHIDGHWYRVCISNIINDHVVTVYFCDFGDVSVLTLDKLLPLGSQFLDLPYQAIKARLVGIQPVNFDWSVDDCLRFQELVVERNFVSIVIESAPDKMSPADTVLGLKLIDVSSEEDVFIDKLLVEEGRATFIEKPE